MVAALPVLVAGAGSGVGLEVVKILCASAVPVCALIRNKAYEAELQALGAEVLYCDVSDSAATSAALKGSGAGAIVCTLGSKPGETRRIDFIGVQKLVDGAKQTGIKRFILVTSFGCGETRNAVPPPLLEKIGAALAEKDKAEALLRASGLEYTILRPGGLNADSPTGRGVFTESTDVHGGISRADVAEAIVRCLGAPGSRNRTLGLFDRELVRAGTLSAVTIE